MGSVPRSEQFDDVYFSVEDGLAETRHVFLGGNRLRERWSDPAKAGVFTIAETGFGTGLNFLAVWHLWIELKGRNRFGNLEFISVEKYPVSSRFIREVLSVWADEFSDILEPFCNGYPQDLHEGIHVFSPAPDVRVSLHIGDANDVLPQMEGRVDAWFLDGFKPASNPEMWTQRIFENMARLSVPGASFATFTAAGAVKRGLRDTGFEVTKVKGFGRKRDMLRGDFARD